MRFQHLIHRIKSLGPSPAPDVDSERRLSWRINRKVGLLGFRKGGQKIKLTTINLGPGGMRLQAPVALKAGEQLRLQPTTMVAGDPHWSPEDDGLAARVVWCRRGRNASTFEVGVSFDRPGDTIPLPLEGLLESCGVRVKSSKEQRKAPRVGTLHLQGFLYTKDDQVNAVEVRDLAVGGALLISPRRLPLETPLHLKVPLGDQGDFESPGRVVRVRDAEAPGMSLLAVAFSLTDVRQRDKLAHYLVRHLKDHDDHT